LLLYASIFILAYPFSVWDDKDKSFFFTTKKNLNIFGTFFSGTDSLSLRPLFSCFKKRFALKAGANIYEMMRTKQQITKKIQIFLLCFLMLPYLPDNL
jgi:hypothetical protein